MINCRTLLANYRAFGLLCMLSQLYLLDSFNPVIDLKVGQRISKVYAFREKISYILEPASVLRKIEKATFLFAASGGDSSNISPPKLDENEDYYSVLEVPPTADTKSIKKAFTKLVLKYHPDNKRDPEVKDICNRQMMVINAAYKVLKDPVSRAEYDRKRAQGLYRKQSRFSKSTGRTDRSSTAPNSAQQRQQGDANFRRDTQSEINYNDAFGSSFGSDGVRRNEMEESAESMEDLLSDIFRDIVVNKGSNLMRDINEFLNSQVSIIESMQSSYSEKAIWMKLALSFELKCK